MKRQQAAEDSLALSVTQAVTGKKCEYLPPGPILDALPQPQNEQGTITIYSFSLSYFILIVYINAELFNFKYYLGVNLVSFTPSANPSFNMSNINSRLPINCKLISAPETITYCKDMSRLDIVFSTKPPTQALRTYHWPDRQHCDRNLPKVIVPKFVATVYVTQVTSFAQGNHSFFSFNYFSVLNRSTEDHRCQLTLPSSSLRRRHLQLHSP